MRIGRILLFLAAVACSLSVVNYARAAEYPTRPIRWIIGYPPGGASDYLVRAVSAELEKELKGTVVIENKPGASGIIAAAAVHQAQPDGYTLLLESDGYFNNVALGGKFNFDPLDFDYLTRLALIPNVVVVPPSSPIKTIADLIAAAKKDPGKLQFASGGVGTGTHIATEMFMERTGTKMMHIPYKGTQAPLLDLAAGRISVMFAGASPALPMIKSGQLRPVAVTSAEPIEALPNVPPISATVPGFDQQTWYVAMAPKGLDPAVKARLVNAMHHALATATVKNGIAKFAFTAAPTSPEEFEKFLKSTLDNTRAIAKTANISLH
ncbi:MAG TPA: tripartite tricarboxylate transporter substrate binding protein [Pseudolabrys sp.]|nr:tripartite tricarboxylate transporter substrate binding protein [Pseudolabrys sp.]